MVDELMIEREKLKLTKEEEEAIEYEDFLEERKKEIALSLLEKFLAPNIFSVKAMKTIMQTRCQPSRGIVVKELDKNLFLFQFFLQKNKEALGFQWPPTHLEGIDGDKAALENSEGLQHLDYASDECLCKFLGDKVGAFVRCDENKMLGMNKTLCFRVEVDVLRS
ncbi:hypothetical protein Cgig2_024055 [Carnegiea gigantea]|uniref:Uncharacterized protein n=1 Tax=Carnegiea gigantea TaxID=171969 RepID=A0A9Q1KHJ6_9CARY|nr:hypothetical protein Cgig2_024055 [Carnegiea gigantea]